MIDFKKFKKTEENEKYTVLQHDNGHEIKISHKGLSDSHKDELAKMPIHAASGGKLGGQRGAHRNKGGNPQVYQQIPGHGIGPEPASVSQKSQPSKPKSDPAYTEPRDAGVPKPPALKGPLYNPNTQELHEHEAEQTLKRGFTIGTGKNSGQIYPPCVNPSCKSYGRSHPNCRCYGGNELAFEKFAEGGQVDGYCSEDRAHQKGCEYYAEGSTEAPVGEAPSVNLSAQDIDPNIEPSLDPNAQMPQAATQPDVTIPESSGAKAAEPQPEQAPERAPSSEPPPAIEQAQSEHEATRSELLNEANAHQQDLNMGHIKAENYKDLFDKKSTLGKIGTIFGLMVGGAGSSLSGQPNMLLEMMNKEIGNDLESQKQSAANRQNFLSLNSHIIHGGPYNGMNVEAAQKAYGLTRMQMNLSALHHLVEMNNKLPEGSPQRQQGDAVLAMMNSAVQNENFNIADRAGAASAAYKTLSGAGGNTTAMKSGMFGPEVAKVGEDLEQKTIPGISGKASRPIQQHDRDQVQAMNVLDNKIADVLQFAKQHKGSLNPKVLSQGSQKAAELVNFYNQSIGAGVLTQGRLAWLDSQINKNPTSVFQDILGNNAKLGEIKNSNSLRRDLLLKSYGFPAKKSGGSDGSTPSGEIKRQAANGKTAVFDSNKNFLRYE